MIRVWLRALIAAALLLLAQPARTASADNLPYPCAVTLDRVADAVLCSQLKVPPDVVFAAYEQYCTEFEQAVVKADAEFIKIYQQAHVPLGTFLGVQDTKRLNEIDERAAQAGQALIGALADRIAAAAAGGSAAGGAAAQLAQEEAASALRQMLQLAQASSQIRGGVSGMLYIHSPQELSSALCERTERMTDDEVAPLLPALQAAHVGHAQARLNAMQEFLKVVRANRLEAARLIEDGGAVGKGMSNSGLKPEVSTVVWKLMHSPGMESNAWRAMVREGMAAFGDSEAQLTPGFRAALLRHWVPQALEIEGGDELDLPFQPGVYDEGPSGFMKCVLRITTLSPKEVERARAIGKKWAADDIAAQRAVIDACAAGKPVVSSLTARKALSETSLKELATKANIPSLAADPPRLPEGELAADLSAEDEAAFGKLWKPPPPGEDLNRRKALFDGKPLKYSPEMVQDLFALLQLTADQQAILEVALTDARAEWDRSVAALVDASYEPPYDGRPNKTPEEWAEWYAGLFKSVDAWGQSIAAADACDAKLFTGLKGAFAGKVNDGALDLALAARRTREATQSKLDRSSNAAIVASPIDVPRAVLSAPLTPEGRTAAIAAVAASAAEWRKLGQERATLISQYRGNQMRDGPPVPVQNEPKARATAAAAAAEAAAIRAAWGERWQAVRQSWTDRENAAVERVAGVLGTEDAIVWRTFIQRLRWPQCYYSFEDLRKQALADAGKAPDPEATLVRVEELLKEAEAAAIASGDAAVAMMAAFPEEQREGVHGFSMGRSNSDRLRALRSMDWWRWLATAERVRAVLPEESLKTSRRSTMSRRLAEMARAGGEP